MPEQLYRDLTPDFRDIPCEAWDGVDVPFVVASLIERTGIPEANLPKDLGLLALTRLVKVVPMPEEERTRLALTRPDLLRSIEASQERQRRLLD